MLEPLSAARVPRPAAVTASLLMIAGSLLPVPAAQPEAFDGAVDAFQNDKLVGWDRVLAAVGVSP